ncbi:hypothetical protein BH09PAT1_BH09PAT1_4790 [soil metagenome]
MADDGRGNFGNTEEHQKAGSMSSGNQKAAENLSTEDRSKGGQASHSKQNTQNDANLTEETEAASDIE